MGTKLKNRGLGQVMKSRTASRARKSFAILSAIVCAFTLSACGSRAGEKVDNSVSKASSSPGNEGTPLAVSNPSPTVPSATATDKAMSQSTTQTRNNDNARVAAGPKPQIGTGGNDLFQFTQARAAISADPEFKSADIVIEVKAGVLTLSGSVANAAQKLKAEQLVRAVDGVRGVNTRLRVSN
jgi:hypothetical protein